MIRFYPNHNFSNRDLHCFIISGNISSPANYRPYNLSLALKKNGIDVLIICESKRENLKIISFLRDSEINVETYPEGKIVFSIIKTRLILFKLRPTFIYQTNPTLRAFLSLFLINTNLIGEWDEPNLLKFKGFRRLLELLLHLWFLNKSKIKISCTKYYSRFIPNSVYIPHGQYLDTKYTEYISEEKNDKYFAYLGKFYPLWDHDLLFENLLQAKIDGFTPKIKFIGDGPDYKYWQKFKKTHQLDNIEFMGFVSQVELIKILKNAHALLFPMRDTPINKSRCSSKIFAYIASNRPIIAHKVGEIKSILDEKAYLYPPGTNLIKVLNDLPEMLPGICYDHKKYSYETIAKKYINLKDKLL